MGSETVDVGCVIRFPWTSAAPVSIVRCKPLLDYAIQSGSTVYRPCDKAQWNKRKIIESAAQVI